MSMDEHFQRTAFTIIERFMEKVSTQCELNKENLWSIWREMYNFPIVDTQKKSTSVKSKKEKSTTPSVATEASSTVAPTKEKVEDTPVSNTDESDKKADESGTKADEPITPVSNESNESNELNDTGLKKSPKKGTLCQYAITRGERKGQVCGKPCKSDKTLCTVHSK